MIKLISSGLLLALVLGLSQDSFEKLPRVQSFEVEPGLIMIPRYSASHDVCEMSIEKRHYVNGTVDFDALMSKEQILLAFERLVSKKERGRAGGKVPGDTEITEIDSGMRTQRIPYEHVTLAMYGHSTSSKYLSAVISWNKRECESIADAAP
jgi:hypothetical protein